MTLDILLLSITKLCFGSQLQDVSISFPENRYFPSIITFLTSSSNLKQSKTSMVQISRTYLYLRLSKYLIKTNNALVLLNLKIDWIVITLKKIINNRNNLKLFRKFPNSLTQILRSYPTAICIDLFVPKFQVLLISTQTVTSLSPLGSERRHLLDAYLVARSFVLFMISEISSTVRPI